MNTKEITILADVFYSDYSWMDENERYRIYRTGDVSESENQIKILSGIPVTVKIPVIASDEVLLKQNKIRILEEKQAAIREKALKEMQEIAEKIQDLKGIEYIPEVKL